MAYTGYTDSLDVTAWKNPDGENVLILLNKTDKTLPCVLRINQMAAGFEMKPGAILSCVIKRREAAMIKTQFFRDLTLTRVSAEKGGLLCDRIFF